VIAIVAGAVWMFRDRLRDERHEAGSAMAGLDLLARPRFGLGALCIFLYVGAEVAIGSLIVNYLQQSSVLGLEARSAGELIAFYWGGAMVGRFIGSAILRVVSPGLVLTCAAAGAIGLILLSTNTTGTLAGYSLLAVGLMNSIMFPTIFSLASEKLGSRAADGSGIINVAIFGGAVVPLATGALADVSGSLAGALLLPAACYAVIALFGIYCRRNPARDYGGDAAVEATETTSGTHSPVQP
jgi:FHS family L-fucose permease-like MFS transporter